MWGDLYKHYLFLTNMNKYNAHAAECCKICLEKLASNGVTESRPLRGRVMWRKCFGRLAPLSSVRIRAICHHLGDSKWLGFDVMPGESVKDYGGKILVAALFGAESQI